MMRKRKMGRRSYMLAVLAAAEGNAHSPVQVQKLFFLIDKNIPQLVGGPHFHFSPYNYGPFDSAVYQELGRLVNSGEVEVCPEGTWRIYRLTPKGQRRGERLLTSMPSKAQDYIKRVSVFVRGLTFTQLVAAIYKAYPEMQVNSVFQE